MKEDSVFNDFSLKIWLSKKPLALRAAVEKRMEYEENRSLKEETRTQLSSILHLCAKPETLERLCHSFDLQEELLFILSQVPFSARLRFLEVMAEHSLKLVMALMDEKRTWEKHSQAARFIFDSLKHAFALKTLYEIFDPLRLSRITVLLEQKKDEV